MRRRTKITIGTDSGRGFLSAYPRWDYKSLEIARGAPGRTRLVDGKLWFELTKENRAYMETHFVSPVGTELSDDFKLLLADRPGFQTKLPPDPLQVEAAERSEGKKIFAFFEKPGSGKTKILLDYAVKLWCAGTIDTVLVIAPNFVHQQWIVDEIPKHVHPTIPLTTAFWRPGKKPDPSILEPDPSRLRILAVGFESLFSNKFDDVRNEYIASGRALCIIDESHRIKTPSSSISRSLNGISEMFVARAVASGEPIPLGLQDYYAQYRFLSPRILRCYSYAGFKSTFCVMGGFQNRSVVGYLHEHRLHELASPYTHVAKPSIDAAQVWHPPWKFDLHPKTREVYENLRTEMLHELDDGRMASVANQLAALIRLQQVATGRLVLEDGSVEELPTDRPKVLKEILKGLYGKVIIWNEHLADLSAQQDWFKDDAVAIAGPVSPKDRELAKESFLDPSGARFLLATPGAAGTGLDGFQFVCNHNIYYTQRDNAGLRWQSELRTFRRGTTEDVHYFDIIARNTVDVLVQRRNHRKRSNAAMSYNEFRSILEGDYEPST